jgi:hypothetical protein
LYWLLSYCYWLLAVLLTQGLAPDVLTILHSIELNLSNSRIGRPHRGLKCRSATDDGEHAAAGGLDAAAGARPSAGMEDQRAVNRSGPLDPSNLTAALC